MVEFQPLMLEVVDDSIEVAHVSNGLELHASVEQVEFPKTLELQKSAGPRFVPMLIFRKPLDLEALYFGSP